MTTAVQQLIRSFESLSGSEQHEAKVEILRRSPVDAYGDIPDACLLEAADALFCEMDKEEARHAEN